MSFPIIPKTLKQYLKNPFFVIKKRKEKRKTKEKRRENSILSHSYLSNFYFPKPTYPTGLQSPLVSQCWVPLPGQVRGPPVTANPRLGLRPAHKSSTRTTRVLHLSSEAPALFLCPLTSLQPNHGDVKH